MPKLCGTAPIARGGMAPATDRQGRAHGLPLLTGRVLGWLALALLAAAGAAPAQRVSPAPTGARPLLRFEAGALNPDALDAATMGFGLGAGLVWRDRTTLLVRVLRQSQNRNSGADLERNARNLFSVLFERASGPAVMRRQQYLFRVGAGVMLRPSLPAAPVATLGLGIRYPLYHSVSLVAGFEDDVAALPAGSYAYDYYEPAYLSVVHVEVNAVRKVQSNFGLLLAVEWHLGN
jgi:hypothetical protein